MTLKFAGYVAIFLCLLSEGRGYLLGDAEFCGRIACFHGDCVVNTFCQCWHGWTGVLCNQAITTTTTTVATTRTTPTQRCRFPFSPGNGSVDYTGTTLGSIALYSCNSAFSLVGAKTRTCLQSGQWSASEPSCVRNCNLLMTPLHGSVIATGYTAGSIATYSCINGYTMNGYRYRICGSSGTWSGTDPICQQKVASSCPSVNSTAHGIMTVTGTSVGDTAMCQCISGFIMVGSSSRTCQVNGAWSGQQPTCVLRH